MIELPTGTIISGFEPMPQDFGSTVEPSTGAALERYDRKGNRWQIAVELAPMAPRQVSVAATRLTRGKSELFAMPVVLQESQGSPGMTLVNGAGQAGKTLSVKAATPGYVAKEGYWLSITDANGRHYLHKVAGTAVADGSGIISIPLNEELRHPFADNAVVRLATPMVSGLVIGEFGWALSVHFRTPLSFLLKEVA